MKIRNSATEFGRDSWPCAHVSSGLDSGILRGDAGVRDKLKVLTLDELRALPEEPEKGRGCAVYFLWLRDELQYVGSSRDVGQRLILHHHAQKSAPWDFYPMRVPHDRATILACGRDERLDLEGEYIQLYRPPHNRDPDALR